MPPEIRQPIIDGLTRVVTDQEGTASKAFVGFPLDQFPVAGKTGTAEVDGKADTALFAAFGPVNQPKYAVLAVLEESGFGADAAVPLVRQVFEQIRNPSRQVAPVPDNGTPATSTPADAAAAAASTATASGSATVGADEGPDVSSDDSDVVTDSGPSSDGTGAGTTDTSSTVPSTATTATPPTSVVAPPATEPTAPPTSASTGPATTDPASSGGAGQNSTNTSVGAASVADANAGSGGSPLTLSEGVPPNRSGP